MKNNFRFLICTFGLAVLLCGFIFGGQLVFALDVRPTGDGVITQTSRPIPVVVDEKSLEKKAIAVLLEASVSQNPHLRANTIEAMQQIPSRALPLVHKGLEDRSAVVRFTSAVTAGLLDFKTLVPAIIPLLKDENASVRAASICALYKLGQKVDLSPLGQLLESSNPQARSNTAMLLGLLGDESAVPMLNQAALVPMPRSVDMQRAAVVRTQIAEAIVKLGDDTELSTIRAGAYSPHGEVRVLSITAMGAIGDYSMGPALKNILEIQPPESVEVRLAAAGALARLRKYQGLGLAMEKAGSDNPVIRSQAAWVLGWFTDQGSLVKLMELAADNSQQVRVSAASSILRRTRGNQRF